MPNRWPLGGDRLAIFSDYRRLGKWEEAVGVLHGLQKSEGVLLAKIGQICIALPEDMAERLSGVQGCKIGLLRTDFDYRFRIISDQDQSNKESTSQVNAAQELLKESIRSVGTA
jgi:hypothetical protein